jgi:hypothetical protein
MTRKPLPKIEASGVLVAPRIVFQLDLMNNQMNWGEQRGCYRRPVVWRR